jgi:hypothetical protein
MTRANAALSLPPGDRDDAPELGFMVPEDVAPSRAEIAASVAAAQHEETIALIERLGRHQAEADHFLVELFVAIQRDDEIAKKAAVKRLAEHARDASGYAARLERIVLSARSNHPAKDKE